MANPKVLRKTQLLRLLVNELCDSIEAREARESNLHTYPRFGYGGLGDGQGKTQIQNDIRRCRRTLLDLFDYILDDFEGLAQKYVALAISKVGE